MIKTIATLVLAMTACFAAAQKKAPKKPEDPRIPIKTENWDATQKKAKFADHKGVPSIEVNGDLVIAKNIDFSNGTIEFDVDTPQGFVGIYFRRQSEDESEFFYLRDVPSPTASVDAIQYAPIIKKINMWDMYYDYQSGANFRKDNWTHIKLVISGMQMLVYVGDMSTPALQIPRLEGNTKNGSIAFQGMCFIANVIVKPNEVESLNPNEGADPAYNDIRYLRSWQVSEPSSLPEGQELSNGSMPDIQTKWQSIVAERRGLVNLTRLYGGANERRYVWLRTKIVSKKERKMKIDLGFSDEVWVFVNDRASFVDKNLYGQGMKKKPDGRISTLNANFEIQLKEGENDLVVGVANDFYGWGIIARLEDLDGITLNTDYKQEVIDKDLEKFFGVYSSKEIPMKLKVSQKDSKLSVLPTAESPILFTRKSENEFQAELYEQIILEFNPTENKLTLKSGPQTFLFTKD